ncbi:PfkB family carbohydrate kinase [Kribbella sp. NPDC050241]|uniref:PfkB family carbohydrate kinase n=1 Tax=Kribbella sp. NPDC050241 TaxID=3364115 RepID=UPI003789119A
MAEQFPPTAPDPSLLVAVFEYFRKGAGLSAGRLVGDRRAAPLLRLPAVQRDAPDTEAMGATAFRLVVEAVGSLDVTDQVVAAVALGLGIHLDAYANANVSAQILHNLRSTSVTTRRRALREHWSSLHLALGAIASGAPSDRYLRGQLEPEVFEKLARLVVAPAAPEPSPTSQPDSHRPPSQRKVVVVGGVAIDHIWRVDQIPEVETSTLASTYVRTPGGKGLTQAIATARMGLDVALIAAVTDDPDAGEITDRLTTAGVDLALLQRIPGLRTGQTGIHERPRGESNAAAWRGSAHLTLDHMEKHAQAIAGCDVLMVTFEIPKPVLYRTLDIARSAGRSPLIIVTPGQPYPDGTVSIEHLSEIDYLVAHLWELEKFPRSPEARYDAQLLSQELLEQRVKTLCILDNHGGAIYPHGSVRPISTPPIVSLKEGSITRDVFCAALALNLSDGRPLTDEVIEWASMAMTCFADDYRSQLAPTTPTRERVEREIALRGNR